MKFLCTGDIHLGRRPKRIPEGADGRRFSAAAGWEAVVERAIAGGVDAVALTGDLVDRENRFYEAFGPLHRGLRRLEEAGIETFAVAGNHDFDTLPRFAASAGLKRFRLLGAGGRWESVPFERHGRAVRLHGWSFPQWKVTASPLAGFTPPREEGPSLALLHGDLDRTASDHAPFSAAELRARPVSAWLLGHIHKPELREGPGLAPILYPGSPQPLDPGETGAHGPWLMEIDAAGAVQAKHIPLATLRYEPLPVDLEGVSEETGLDQRLTGELRKLGERVEGEGAAVELVLARLRLTGRMAFHRSLPAHCEKLRDHLRFPHGRLEVVVEKIEIDTRPAIDLRELARGSDAPGRLARIILSVEENGGGEAVTKLLDEARQRIDEVRCGSRYRQLGAEPIAPATARRVLHRQGLRLLDALLAQKEGA